VWCVLILGLSMTALTIPVFTSAAVQRLGIPETAGLSVIDTIRLSAAVRALVADSEYDPLPATWRGAPAFDEASVSHLLDVRGAVIGGRLATGVTAAMLAGWIGLCVARRRWRPLALGMRAGGWATLGLVVLIGLIGLTDFDSFFVAFHGVLFKAGTWTFPYDSMLIRLFPERFWVTAAASWAVLAIVCSAGVLAAARWVPRQDATP
jgi:integral membrane protein (TIGR01906 family)